MAEETRTYCMNCFTAMPAGETRCPRCGWRNEGQEPDALPYATVLAGKYLIGQAVRENGVGITYVALESKTNEKVEIREFFPDNIAFRDPNGITVKPAAGLELIFADYLNEFERSNQNFARLAGIRDLCEVRDLFAENNTQYAVFRYTKSVSLRDYVRENGPLPWTECEALFLPLIRSLSAMASKGVEHLGISPDTLRVTDGGRLILSEFEMPSARRAGTDIVEDICPGCWAIEQYSRTKMCDEVTDVYGLSASLFFALSGSVPTEAPKRRKDPKLMIDRSVVRSLPRHAAAAIANGLQVEMENRTPSFPRLLAELTAASKTVTQVEEIETTRALPLGKRRRPHAHSLPLAFWLILSFVVTLTVLVILSVTWFEDSEYSLKSILDTVQGASLSSNAVGDYELPNLIGQELEEVQTLQDRDPSYAFALDVVEETSETVPAGWIIDQYPKAGVPMENGDRVRVSVSTGSAQRELPEVAGLSYDEAEARLLELGFLTTKEFVYSETVEPGIVIGYWEDHQAGESFPRGAAVQLLVSGEEEGEEDPGE